ncbi:hypothetical protein FQU76_03490 [Streptomyces qinzhouensis]|uniref:Uncharacterized protein n=1 Tax=Streptomyces qinzhouensis TaxID=2599401 RepID=A0A5B8JRT8_9ACTN|nr:hypothetical protein FQU76_03490 [Streptomyces qinzhouensis]
MTALTVWAVLGLTVTGCVTVAPQRSAEPAPPPPTSAPPPAVVHPQIVRQPALESLVGPPGATPAPSAPRTARPAAPPPRTERRRPPAAAPERPRARPAQPPRRPVTVVPRGAVPDVCGLAEAYGGWRRDSAQARICRDAARR